MQDNNLFGDDSTPASPAPLITEISLKDISSAVDLNEFRRQQREELSRYKLTKEKAIDDSADLPEWLLKPSEPLNSRENAIYESETETATCSHDISPGGSLISRGLLECHDSSICDRSADANPFYASPVIDHSPPIYDLIEDNVEPENERQNNSNCGTASGDNRAYTAREKYLKPLPNGNLFADSYRPLRIDETVTSKRCLLNDRFDSQDVELNRRSSLPINRGHGQLSLLEPRKKRKSFYDRTATRPGRTGNRTDRTDYSFNIDQFSKEELLCMWKSKELELNTRLKEAVRDKEKLEHKLAGKHYSTPV